MDFENIVISPPDNYMYRFLNFIPIVINLHTLRFIRKSKNRLEVSFNIMVPFLDCKLSFSSYKEVKIFK